MTPWRNSPPSVDPIQVEAAASPAWMAGFGQLARLRGETARIQALIDADLRQIDAEDRA
jgi:hypothetical protein